MHPVKPGRFVLAIECDGASYHSAPTARDRDRLRQQQLEALGWRFHRIWSTDWFLRREDEVKRALAAYRTALMHADALDRDGPLQPAGTPSLEFAGLQPAVGRKRRAKPRLWPGRPIDEYSPVELETLVSWVLSDGRLPTDEEIIEELTRELGFHGEAAKSSRLLARRSEPLGNEAPPTCRFDDSAIRTDRGSGSHSMGCCNATTLATPPAVTPERRCLSTAPPFDSSNCREVVGA
jgi:hypothetical protein